MLAALVIGAWLLAGLFLTLSPAHPLPGQVVDDNLIPLHTIRIYLANLGSWFWMRNALGNLGLLLPIGLLGPVVLPPFGRWWRVVLVALAISTAIEVTQLWIPDRSADVDDVIANVAGALLGYATLLIARAVKPAGPVR